MRTDIFWHSSFCSKRFVGLCETRLIFKLRLLFWLQTMGHKLAYIRFSVLKWTQKWPSVRLYITIGRHSRKLQVDLSSFGTTGILNTQLIWQIRLKPGRYVHESNDSVRRNEKNNLQVALFIWESKCHEVWFKSYSLNQTHLTKLIFLQWECFIIVIMNHNLAYLAKVT